MFSDRSRKLSWKLFSNFAQRHPPVFAFHLCDDLHNDGRGRARGLIVLTRMPHCATSQARDFVMPRLRMRSGGLVTFTSASPFALRAKASLTRRANTAGMNPLNPGVLTS
jgi:hypothetical protein